MVGMIEPGPERAFALVNCNAAKYDAPVSNTDEYDNYHEGYPDVDTYRDMEFYLEVHLNKNQGDN